MRGKLSSNLSEPPILGYTIFLMGALLEVFGFSVGTLLSIPGGLFEVFLGLWLIFKGFNTTAIASEI